MEDPGSGLGLLPLVANISLTMLDDDVEFTYSFSLASSSNS